MCGTARRDNDKNYRLLLKGACSLHFDGEMGVGGKEEEVETNEEEAEVVRDGSLKRICYS